MIPIPCKRGEKTVDRKKKEKRAKNVHQKKSLIPLKQQQKVVRKKIKKMQRLKSKKEKKNPK